MGEAFEISPHNGQVALLCAELACAGVGAELEVDDEAVGEVDRGVQRVFAEIAVGVQEQRGKVGYDVQ